MGHDKVKYKKKQMDKKRKQANQLRRRCNLKRRQHSSIPEEITPILFPAPGTTGTISASARQGGSVTRTHILPIPHSVQQRDENLPIVVNGVEVPSLCGDIKRKDALEEALKFLTRTQVQ